MGSTRWDKRFLATTRGRVASLLRREGRTVDELATELDLTDNAVRAHLAALERDGLVAQGNPRRGGSKPAFTYQLTAEAERLFPKAYGPLLTRVLTAVGDRLSPKEMQALFTEIGHRLAADYPAPVGDSSARLEAALRVLADLGGAAELEDTSAGTVIRGCDCPLAAAVEGSPAACLIAATLLSDLCGQPVTQQCDPGPPPRCRFVITSAPDPNHAAASVNARARGQ